MNNSLNFFGSYSFKFPTIGTLTGYKFAGGGDGGIARSISMTVVSLEAFGAVIIDHGFCLSSSTSLPTVNDSVFSSGKSANPTVASITHSVSLGLSTTYYIRGYVQNVRGITYSNVIVITTDGIGINTPNVSTSAATSVGNYSATVGGNVTSDGGATVTTRGVCWNTTGQLNQLGTDYQSSGSGTGSFTVGISGLDSGTTYYYQAYATNSQGTSFGSQLTFTTETPAVLPTISTLFYSSVTQTSAVCSGNVISEGTYTVVSRGICYSSSNSVPTTNDNTSTSGSGSGSYSCSLSGLTPATRYYYIAYCVTSTGIITYGSASYFDTLSPIILPTVSTLTVSNITQNGATSGVNVTSEGTYSVTTKGICYSPSNSSPTLSDDYAVGGGGTGSVTLGMSGLTVNTTYYVRAFATNSQGTTVYGATLSFTTLGSSITTPTVAYLSITDITTNSLNVSADVLDDGGATVTSRGFYWSYNSNFSGQSTITVGSGLGSFSTTISGLTTGSTVYVKAFATNSAGTSTTGTASAQLQGPQYYVPTVSTISVYNVGTSYADLSGNATADGGLPIQAKGFVWVRSSLGTPTLTFNDGSSSNGTGIGGFGATITGLTAGTSYNFCAYAENDIGIAYGNVISFTTISTCPVPAAGGLNFPSYGTNPTVINTSVTGYGCPILERLIVYGTSPNPTKYDNSISLANVEGMLTTNFTVSGTWYFGAYVRTAGGESYLHYSYALFVP